MLGGGLIPNITELHINKITPLIDSPIEIAPMAIDLDVGRISVPLLTGFAAACFSQFYTQLDAERLYQLCTVW